VSLDKAVSELIYRSCLLLNELDFAGYLELCASEFRYRITAWSPNSGRKCFGTRSIARRWKSTWSDPHACA
jgi:3-phenylpropionate/cinnamic acid dioxygenase small subunit